MDTINEYKYNRAKKRVKCIKGFYGNLIAYLIVISVLAYINYRTTSFLWVLFPAVGWGFGLIANGLHAFGYNPIFGKDWEERKIKELMNNDNF
ncbi:2TM domain-containing protein [Croceitalea rosinachiae]|uniref:2TM domain-containing protein n=1 Tax=Croceitalea rosinachiae TaxID=3075596 RepID=A0ABU3AA90_9FLAO|nr:2TM domain-containing protein [Croceitalea sp. F388]MDT0607103.1 2TM domain-containing protein [Croceitalea sp. F388]